MELFDLLGQDQTRPLVMAAWRCAIIIHGAPYVEVAGDLVLPQWCADSLASQVSRVTTSTSLDPAHQNSEAV